jgi:hypothetical protein
MRQLFWHAHLAREHSCGCCFHCFALLLVECYCIVGSVWAAVAEAAAAGPAVVAAWSGRTALADRAVVLHPFALLLMLIPS